MYGLDPIVYYFRGALVTETQRNVDKVAVMGDLPLLGRLFRHDSTSTVRKRLYIFVSPVVGAAP
jgi:type II secretory pathway component GspD/PulD (secretin)